MQLWRLQSAIIFLCIGVYCVVLVCTVSGQCAPFSISSMLKVPDCTTGRQESFAAHSVKREAVCAVLMCACGMKE